MFGDELDEFIDFRTRGHTCGRWLGSVTRGVRVRGLQRCWLLFGATVWDVQQTAWLFGGSIVRAVTDVVALAKNLNGISFLQVSHFWFADDFVFDLARMPCRDAW